MRAFPTIRLGVFQAAAVSLFADAIATQAWGIRTPSTFGCWLLVVGGWLLVTGGWWLVEEHMFYVARFVEAHQALRERLDLVS